MLKTGQMAVVICSFCLNLQPSPGSEKTCNACNHPKQMNFTPSYHVQFKVLRYSQADIYTETVFSSLYLSPNIYPVFVQLGTIKAGGFSVVSLVSVIILLCQNECKKNSAC